MKKMLILFLFCLNIHAQESDTAVDIAYMNLTGLSTLDVFLLDVDNEDAESIQFTQNFDLGTCLEGSDGSDQSFEICELTKYPPYLDVWQIQYDANYFHFENTVTDEIFRLYYCELDSIHCQYELSHDGRWLVFNSNEGLMLADLGDFGEAELMPIIDGETYTSIFFWLNDRHLLYWHEMLEHYFIYDLASQLHYPLEHVLDRESLEINTDESEGMVSLPEVSILDESFISEEVKENSQNFAWRPDHSGLIYGSSDYELSVEQYCDNCAVAYWDIEQNRSEFLFGLEGEASEMDEVVYSGGWFLSNLHWSPDGSQFVAGFTRINDYHQPDQFWLYDMESRELQEAFTGDRVQWLR